MDKRTFFEELGFTVYESKVLSSFAKMNAATPKQISLDSGVPQNKLYSIIKKFEQKGLLSEVPGNSKKYRLINLRTLIRGKIREKDASLKKLKEASKSIANMEESKEDFTFSLIRGQREIMNRLSEENSNVKKEILSVQRNWRYWGEGIRAIEKSIKKGVDVKMIGVINEETWKRAKEWKKAGCKIAKYNEKFGENPLRFSVFDKKYARITIGKQEIKDRKDYITIWTDSRPLVMLLKNQFLEMWKECEKV